MFLIFKKSISQALKSELPGSNTTPMLVKKTKQERGPHKSLQHSNNQKGGRKEQKVSKRVKKKSFFYNKYFILL